MTDRMKTGGKTMYDRMPTLTGVQMTKIHDASMNILSSVGVAFNEVVKKTTVLLFKY
jgi:trimethylamine:corrinoid methyltransferase-like protein